jgi:hypothetical protein
MLRSSKLVVFGLAIWMLAARDAQADVGFQPVSTDELKMTSEPLAPGAAAIILYRQVDRDDYAHPSHEDDYVRIKILTEEGRKYANVEIPFDRSIEDVVDIKARTIRPDGSITDFGGQIFENYLVKGKGIKYLAKTFTLPGVKVGSIIEYSYRTNLREYVIFDSHWILDDELFTKKARFSLIPFRGRSNVPLSLRWSFVGLPEGAIPKQGADHVWRMQASNIPAFQTEDYMPPPNELKARVDFVYSEFTENDSASFWKHIGKDWNEYLEIFVGKKKEMERAVAQIVAPGDAPEVKLRKIYDRVQQIRNTSYEVQKTAQEEKRSKEKWAENVADVWKRGYGSGTQLTWLFLGLVRAAGFEAYGCWISDRQNYFFNPVLMQNQKLNTNVVLIRLNGKDLYFDPGAEFTPFGMLTWSETDVKGLRLDKDGGSWIQTTLPQASESRIERVGQLKLLETGDVVGKLTLSYTGLVAMYHRLEEHHADDVERKKYLEELVTEQIPVVAEAELTNKPDWKSSETPLVSEFSVKIPGWTSNAGRRVLLPAAIFTAGERGVFEHANRVHPIYFAYPYEKADDVTIELPDGWQVSSLPLEQDQDGRVILYKLKAEKAPGTLRLRRAMTFNVLLVDQNYYGAMRSFFQTVRNGDGEQVVLDPGGAHASN